MAGFLRKLKDAVIGQPEPEARQQTYGTRPLTASVGLRQNAPSGKPADFFPTSVGAKWDFSIEVAGDPLHFCHIAWPAGNGQVGVETRGRFAAVVRNRSRRQFELSICIARPAEAQGPLKYPGGVELIIEKDDLGVYEHHRSVFWAVSSNERERFEAFEVITYAPDHSSAPRMGGWGSWGAGGEGHSLRPLFFAERPNTAISLGQNSPDRLAFEGIDTTKRPQWGDSVLHFVRQVNAAEKPSELSSGFEEHMWYAPGKGLVELKQFLAGRETMHWTLRNFQIGSR
jgi:hypothetical protein